MSDFSSFLQQLRTDFDRVRWESQPIRVLLVHRATNAEAEGVVGIPRLCQDEVAFQGAGHREFRQRIDENGKPLIREDPIVDVEGRPFVSSTGQAIDVVMPAFRTVSFAGDAADCQRLDNLADRAGRLVGEMKELSSLSVLRGWQFSKPSNLWWAVLFELAWAGRHPLLTAVRRLWLRAENPRTTVPYDIDELRGLAASGLAPLGPIPQNWLSRLPDAFMSEISNAAAASFDATEYLLAEICPASPPPPSSKSDRSNCAGDSAPELKAKRRFAVALSFPGEKRQIVGDVANALRDALGEQRVFYDHFHAAELSRPNLDILLQNFYRDESDLVVVFVCAEYAEKEWCGLEWRAIRDLVKNRSRLDEDVMYLRFDDAPLDGQLSIDGFLKIRDWLPRHIADAILRAWSATR